jgi:hypothetical protein
MVQAAHASLGDHLPAPNRETPTPGCLLIQSEVCAVIVVVREVIGDESLQMSLVQRNDMVKQFASAASDPTLRDAILPRALDGGLHARDLHGSNRSRDFESILRVVVKDEELGVDSYGKASRICWTIQLLVGCGVTLKCKMRLRSWLMMKKQ